MSNNTYNIPTGNTYLTATIPTGSLAAYLSSSDPDGWVICDGVGRINSGGIYDFVISLSIGSYNTITNTYTPPDLKGSFLRGIGTSPNFSIFTGAVFKGFQQQKIANHSHNIASHRHNTITDTTNFYAVQDNYDSRDVTAGRVASTANRLDIINRDTGIVLNNATTSSASLVTTNSVASGVNFGSETRPYNYGVNWILKL